MTATATGTASIARPGAACRPYRDDFFLKLMAAVHSGDQATLNSVLRPHLRPPVRTRHGRLPGQLPRPRRGRRGRVPDGRRPGGRRPAGRLGRAGFGHFGAGGSLGFCDAESWIAFCYVMNQMGPRWQSPRVRALVDAVYECL